MFGSWGLERFWQNHRSFSKQHNKGIVARIDFSYYAFINFTIYMTMHYPKLHHTHLNLRRHLQNPHLCYEKLPLH